MDRNSSPEEKAKALIELARRLFPEDSEMIRFLENRLTPPAIPYGYVGGGAVRFSLDEAGQRALEAAKRLSDVPIG